jgi:hypothetical protein
MLSYHDLKSNSRVLRAFTSLDPAEFEMLLIPDISVSRSQLEFMRVSA